MPVHADFVELKDHKQRLDAIVQECPTGIVMVHGPCGSGKSMFVRSYFQNNKYAIFFYNTNKILFCGDIHAELTGVSSSHRFGCGEHKIVVIIDDLDGIHAMDKTKMAGLNRFISDRVKFTTPDRTSGVRAASYGHDDGMPLLICVSQTHPSKFIRMSDRVGHIEFTNPDTEDMAKVIHQYYPTMSKDDREHYSMLVGGDFRKIHQSISTNACHDPPDSRRGDIHGVVESILYAFDQVSIIDVFRQYDAQKIFMPMMVHENYTLAVKNQCKNIETTMQYLSGVCSAGDVVASRIYNSNEHSLGHHYALMTCYGVGRYVHNSKTTRIPKPPKTKFTRLLSRSSLKCVYRHTYNRHVIKARDYYMDRDVVRFNIRRMRSLITKNKNNNKYSEWADLYDMSTKQGILDTKLADKLNKCI